MPAAVSRGACGLPWAGCRSRPGSATAWNASNWGTAFAAKRSNTSGSRSASDGADRARSRLGRGGAAHDLGPGVAAGDGLVHTEGHHGARRLLGRLPGLCVVGATA